MGWGHEHIVKPNKTATISDAQSRRDKKEWYQKEMWVPDKGPIPPHIIPIHTPTINRNHDGTITRWQDMMIDTATR